MAKLQPYSQTLDEEGLKWTNTGLLKTFLFYTCETDNNIGTYGPVLRICLSVIYDFL
jgi:hypothetical protein